MQTYGLRKVHLQSSGLNVEVSFVTADVLTPLLGLDTMIKNSLSLHVEHDQKHYLVIPAGDTTQQSARTSMMHLDYAYIQQPQDQQPTAILTWVESLTGLAGSLMTTEKGHTTQQLDAVVNFITRNGFASSTLHCDGEPALVQLVEEIGKQTSLPLARSLALSHQHEAWQKSLFTQSRASSLDFSVTDTSFILLRS